ncbi:YncE family protein [Rhodopseudomonas sp.]|uniref:YncE family protein n=1 Tax=Rhodopseudomonas sp. TaxID=1078 RepID=UPI0039E49EA9
MTFSSNPPSDPTQPIGARSHAGITRRRLLGTALVGAASLLAAAPARAETYRDYRRTIFVARRGVTALDAIDVDSDTVTGTLELGLEPRELQISQRGGRLAAIDLSSPRLVSVDLATQSRRDVPLPFIPSRLRISPDGQRLAALDDARGTIVANAAGSTARARSARRSSPAIVHPSWWQLRASAVYRRMTSRPRSLFRRSQGRRSTRCCARPTAARALR